MRAGLAASAGAEPARLSARLQVQVQPEDPAPAQTGAAGLRDAGAGIQQLPAGRRVEKGERHKSKTSSGVNKGERTVNTFVCPGDRTGECRSRSGESELLVSDPIRSATVLQGETHTPAPAHIKQNPVTNDSKVTMNMNMKCCSIKTYTFYHVKLV